MRKSWGPGTSGWRGDIDGLRGIAVAAVVIYHFFPDRLLGGFVGVDIFFVISGYLITKILARDLDAGNFSIIDFYARRIRRIVPALLLVLAAVCTLGWWLLYQDEYALLGADVAAGAGFVANLRLWASSGYFDRSIDTKPLAHLWSLGVEEQFYLLWPLLLLLAWKGRRRVWLLPALVLAASFAASIVALHLDPIAAFYLPFFRLWELAAGALLALRERTGATWSARQAEVASATGVLLLVAALLLTHSNVDFPGWWACLPVAGTGLLIAAGPGAWTNRRLLARPVLVGLGLISFPLYLWHWPVLVTARTVFNGEPRLAGLLLLLAVSTVLAILTYRWVESPLRGSPHLGRHAGVLAGALAAMGIAGVLISSFEGVPGRGVAATAPKVHRDHKLPATALADCRLPDPVQRSLVKHCARDGRGPERFGIVGDSKAESLFPGLLATATDASRWVFVGGSLQHTQVVPVLSNDASFRRFQPGARVALDAMVANPRVETIALVMAARSLFQLKRVDTIEDLPESPHYEAARDGLAAFVGELVRAGKSVVLVVDNPTLPDPRLCLRAARWVPPQPFASWLGAEGPPPGCQLPLDRHHAWSAPYRRLLEEVRAGWPNRVHIFDTVPLLCDERRNLCTLADGSTVLYSDSDHISLPAATRVGGALNRFLVQRARPPGAGPL